MLKFIVVAMFALFSAVALARPVHVSGKAEFHGEALAGAVSIPGKGGKVVGTAEVVDGKATGTFTVKLAGLTTENSLRDSHMREKYLQVATYPEAKLVLMPWKPTAGDSDFAGTLTLKSQTKPVHGKAHLADGKLGAAFTVKLSDYPAIGAPSWKSVAVGDEIEVTVEAEAK